MKIPSRLLRPLKHAKHARFFSTSLAARNTQNSDPSAPYRALHYGTLNSQRFSSRLNNQVLDSFLLTGKDSSAGINSSGSGVSAVRTSITADTDRLTETLSKENKDIINGDVGQRAAKLPKHYMDTLEVFKALAAAGFTARQARHIIALTEAHLAANLDTVVRHHVPKMDMENENYLFEAASSELLVEVKRNREQQLKEVQSGVNLLDRELNSVTDELSDLMVTCKNDCEVAMNDHKSDNTLLQKELDIKIREVENRISSQLISEMKFGVERLRWAITRRGIFCILSVAASVLLAVTGSKVVNAAAEAAEQEMVTNTSTKDEFVRDNDEYPKDDANYEQYEEWHEPKKISSLK